MGRCRGHPATPNGAPTRGATRPDWLGVGGLRATRDAGPARAWIRTLEISAAIGPRARLAVLGAGLYLAVDAWSWPGWIIVGPIAWVAFVILGEPLTGRELRDMASAVRAEHGILPPALIDRLNLPRIWQAVLTRAGLGIGVVFVMAVKPPAAVAGTAVVLGALAGYSVARLTSRPGQHPPEGENPMSNPAVLIADDNGGSLDGRRGRHGHDTDAFASQGTQQGRASSPPEDIRYGPIKGAADRAAGPAIDSQPGRCRRSSTTWSW